MESYAQQARTQLHRNVGDGASLLEQINQLTASRTSA